LKPFPSWSNQTYVVTGAELRSHEPSLISIDAGKQTSSSANFEYGDANGDGLGSACPTRAPFGGRVQARCNFDDLALSPISASESVALSINTIACEAGQVRIGVTHSKTPQRFELVITRDNLDLGIDLDAEGRCSAREGFVGVRAPAIAGVTRDGGDAEAFGVWLATPDGQTGSPSCDSRTTAEIRGLRILRSDSEDASWYAPDSRSQYFGSSVASAGTPALLAGTLKAAGGGYLLAYATPENVRLLGLPWSRDLGLESSAELAKLDIRDTQAGQLQLALGGDGDTEARPLLAAWRSGCGDAATIRAARYSWTGASFELEIEPTPLREPASIVDGPAVAYAGTSVHSGKSWDGFALIWIERHGSENELWASSLSDDADTFATPQRLERGQISSPFVLSGGSAPFALGTVESKSPDDRKIRLRVCSAD
jgi:hypothetical protein